MSDSSTSVTKYLRGWLQLLRLPNLLTVPGDVLAGMAVMVYLHASGGEIPSPTTIGLTCLVSLLLYMGGLLHNDLVDQPRDGKERPHRPLPSGTVPRDHAGAGLVICYGGAMIIGYKLLPLVAFRVEGALLLAIVSYTYVKRNHPLAGGALMGLCRGLNVLFGAAMLAGHILDPLLLRPGMLAGCWIVYIFAVTLLAQHETTGRASRAMGLLPALVLLGFAGAYGMIFGVTPNTPLMAFLLFLAFLLAVWSADRIRRTPTPEVIQRKVGVLIRNLIFLQAAACLSWDFRLSMVILALWPINYFLSRWFYAS